MKVGWTMWKNTVQLNHTCPLTAIECTGDSGLGKMIRFLAHKLNEPLELVNLTGLPFLHVNNISATGTDVWDEDTILGAVHYGRVDVMDLFVAMNPYRMQYLRFLYPFSFGDRYFVFGNPEPTSEFSDALRIVKVFTPTLWLYLFALALFCVVAFKMTLHLAKRMPGTTTQTWRIVEHLWMQNTINRTFKLSTSGVVLCTSLLTIFGLILYTNCMLGSLLRPLPWKPSVTTIDELIDKIENIELRLILPGKGLAIEGDILYHGKSPHILRLRAALGKNPIVFERNFSEYEAKIKTNKYVTLTSIIELIDISRNDMARICGKQLVKVPSGQFLPFLGSLVLGPKSTDLVERLDKVLRTYKDYADKLVKQDIQEWWKKRASCPENRARNEKEQEEKIEPLTIYSLLGAALLWAVGILLAIMGCIAELTIFTWRQ